MATGSSKASLIKDDPYLIQLLCDLYTAECDSKGWYKPSDIVARYEREKGFQGRHVIADVERFADEWHLLEWGGETDPDKRQFFRNTEAMEATLDDLRRLLGDRFRDPRDDTSFDGEKRLPALVGTAGKKPIERAKEAGPNTRARPKVVSTKAPHREETGIETEPESTISPVDLPLSGDDDADNAPEEAPEPDEGFGIVQGDAPAPASESRKQPKRNPPRTFGKGK